MVQQENPFCERSWFQGRGRGIGQQQLFLLETNGNCTFHFELGSKANEHVLWRLVFLDNFPCFLIVGNLSRGWGYTSPSVPPLDTLVKTWEQWLLRGGWRKDLPTVTHKGWWKRNRAYSIYWYISRDGWNRERITKIVFAGEKVSYFDNVHKL